MARLARPALLLCCLVPCVALAQTTTTSMTVRETSDFVNGVGERVGDDEKVNIAECDGTVDSDMAFTFTLSSTATEVITDVVLEASDTSGCDSGKTELIGGPFQASSADGVIVSTREIITKLGLSCEASRTIYVCATGRNASGTDISGAERQVTIPLDAAKPNPPAGVNATPGDGALGVSWESVTDAKRYRAEARPQGQTGTPAAQREVSGSTSLRLEGLVNDTVYDVVVFGISDAGNESDPSTAIQQSPQLVNDFWRLYRNAGGTETGGCSTGRAGSLAILGVAVLALRRRRRALLTLLVVTSAAVATPAQAQRKESGRLGVFEIRFGPYRPNVDDGFAVPGPYEQAFGNDRRWMLRGDLGGSIWKQHGSLDLLVGAGWFQAKGTGRLADGSPSGDKTALKVVPTSLTLKYRFDLLAERYHIPLAPYAHVSLERYYWWTTNGAGDTSEDSVGNSGRGATNGWGFGGGLALLLDFIDPQLAAEMDDDTGINSTYLYADISRLKVDDFGSKDSLDLSPEDGVLYTFGLMFVF